MKATKAPVPDSVAAPRRRFVVLPIAIYGITLALIALLWWIGHVRHENVGRYFGEGRPGTTLTVIAFALGGIVAGQTWWLLRPDRFAWFWFAAAVGLIALAIDDQFKGHEAIGDVLTSLVGHGAVPGIDHLDDLVVAAYAPLAAVIAWPFRRRLLRLRGMIAYLAVGFAFFVLMALWDLRLSESYRLDPYAMEESFKLLSAVSIMVAMMSAKHALGLWGKDAKRKAPTPPDP